MQFNQMSETYTFFTKDTAESQNSGTAVLYSGIDSRWTLVRITLETAGGQVAFGFKQDIHPPQSGKGRLLSATRETQIYVPPNQKLYYAADSVQRISISFEPLPWLQQILHVVSNLFASVPKPVQAPIEALKEVVTGGLLVPGWKKALRVGSKRDESRALPGAPTKTAKK